MSVLQRIERGEIKLSVRKVVIGIPGLVYAQSDSDRDELLRLARIGEKMQWIPVGERLPERDKTVLVWGVDKKPYWAKLLSEINMWKLNGHLLRLCWFTHWAELPEPPKEAICAEK